MTLLLIAIVIGVAVVVGLAALYLVTRIKR
jgi:Tfp pilus assembly protein PilW